MDELLGNRIAGKHAVEAPGADLALGIGRIVAASHRTAVVDRLAGDHPADVARMHAADRLLVERAGAGLEVDQHHPLLFGPLAAHLGHRQAAGHVDGDRLGAVHVATGIDAGQGLLRVEVGRADDDHGVRPGVQ